nr:probable LRR receptor-like serine/threonine-protein kinase At1g53430 [Populus alba]
MHWINPNTNFFNDLCRMIRNCSISGEIPPYIGDWTWLTYLDLSFNNLTGGIPDSMKNLTLSKMFLTGNMLNGTVPAWLPHTIEDKADLSYNNFEIPRDGPKKGERKLKISEPNRNSIRDLTDKCGGKPKYDSLYINCGGGGTVFDGKEFEADSATSNYYSAPRNNWAYSCSGDFGSKTYDSTDYIKNVECEDCDPARTLLYNSTRLCPLSLTYYGFCLFKGNYTVKLYFAETVYQNDEDYSNLGKRVFDVYIQGKKELKDFNIKEMASGTNKTWTQSFTAFVGDDHLLTIHFFWAGKGSFPVPDFSYTPVALYQNGPLVAGISVTANFKVGGKGLSPSQIAGITAGSVFAPLLLLAFMWKMGWLRKSELDEITIEVKRDGIYFTLKQIIDATRNFSPKMEIGRGRFGIVYKAELPKEIKLAVKKISPQSKQHGKDELQREIFNLKSLHHENLVQLLDGYSIKDLHLLVYDYMHKRSLHHVLFEPNSTTKLDWKTRFDICRGIARGLKYLHEEKRFKIVHGNIKPSNILLDNSLTAKLSDFGLATLCDEEDPFMAIKAKGSRVYMAPEYSMGKAITVKADVYSFGIVLLEIVSGKVSADYTPNQEAEFLLDKAGVLHDKGRILDLVDKKLASSYDRKQALTILLLAMKCVKLSPTLRPKISEVVSVLEGEKRIDEIFEDDDTPSTNIGGMCGACSRVLEIEPIS